MVGSFYFVLHSRLAGIAGRNKPLINTKAHLQRCAFGLLCGFYKGENAFALGAFYRPNRNVMLSMGTTLTSGDNAYNVGLTFKIGKSGKHREAGLTTADLYAMIGAMQDKMDQQQKKIEELEAKQAK